VDTAGYAVAFSGILSGTGGVIKLGPGKLTLSGANTYTGPTTVQAGTVELATTDAQAPVLTGGGADVQAGKLVFDYSGTSPYDTIHAILRTSFGTGSQVPFAQANGGLIYSTTGNGNYYLAETDDGVSAVTVQYAVGGDADLSGTVGMSDLTIVLNNYGSTSGTWSIGDFDYSSTIGMSDLTIVLSHYGMVLPGETVDVSSYANLSSEAVGMLSAAGFSVVPEPSSIVLLATCLGAIIAFAWRKRK